MLSFTCIGGPKGRKLYTSKENLLLFWGVYMVSFFGVMGQSNWLVGTKQN
jgi:hypothetical protein